MDDRVSDATGPSTDAGATNATPFRSVLVTGGAGYIGSHTTVKLIEAGYRVVIVDNLCNSFPESLRAVREITGVEPAFHCGDIADCGLIEQLIDTHGIEAVLHFAGFKAVGESNEKPLAYYDNNVVGTLRLLQAMDAKGVRALVFSSSATVYGEPERVPLDENSPLRATNPYGRTKLFVEEMLRDLAASNPAWRISLLRYFNPVGAHPSGLLGEDPQGAPNNLVPYIAQVAVGRRPLLNVFGADYDTRDGTGIRDYIHVEDLARGHLAALQFLERNQGTHVHNLGTGRGYSVLEVVNAFERASGRTVPYQVTDRRPGDIAACWADTAKAAQELGWHAELDLEAMCTDAWRWQERNPNGFRQ